MRRRDFLAGGVIAVAGCGTIKAPSGPPAAFGEIRYHTAPDGVRIAYRDSGQADAPAIIFCSGAGTAMASWNMVANPLAATRRVILHDRRGNGDSDLGAPETHTFETFRDDALGVMDTAGIAKAAVCGVAFGARVAMRIARDAPARTVSLILFDATGGPAASDAIRQAGVEEAERLRTAAGIATPARDPAWTANRNPSGNLLNARALTGQPAWISGLQDIRARTLVAVGEQDPNLEGGRRLVREIPNARFELMPMTGHGSYVQRPELVLRLIEGFLR